MHNGHPPTAVPQSNRSTLQHANVIPSRSRPLRRLLAYNQRHTRHMLLATACSILNKIFDLAPPALIGMAVDVVVRRKDSLVAQFGVVDPAAQLILLGLLTVVVWGLESVFEYAYSVVWRNLAQAVQHELRVDAFRHIQGLEMAYFDDRTTGGLLSILGDDVNQLERFLDGGANDLIQVLTTAVIVSATFFLISPALALLALLPIPLILAWSLRFQRRIAPRYAEVRAQVGRLNGRLATSLSAIATIKSFTAERFEVERLTRESAAYRETNRRAIRLSASFSPLIRMAIVVAFVATLLYGGHLVLREQLAVGAYSLLVFLTQRLLWPFTRLATTIDLYHRAMASTARIFDLLDTSPAPPTGTTRLPIERLRGRIAFEDVSFAYRPDHAVLSRLNLAIEPGKLTAIVGPTGAGKSTIIKLLLRFYDFADGNPAFPDAPAFQRECHSALTDNRNGVSVRTLQQAVSRGRILLDDCDIRTLHLEDLRRAISVVSQDVFLFDGTIRENIAYAALAAGSISDDETPASRDRIVAAARLAEAHDFISALPDGYDTRVGERGQKLSAGQRQRIALARALLKNAPVLVLDEATSAVDNETEAAMQRSLERVCATHTVIAIAHRLSTVRNASRIYVLEAGRVAESGTHAELIALGGLYAAMWRIQTGE